MPVSLDMSFERLNKVVAYERYSYSWIDSRVPVLLGYEKTMAAPHIWVPKLTVPQALVVGAAAAIIKNPVITRRFWAGWR